MQQRTVRRQRGLTLVEAGIATALAATLGHLAAGNFSAIAERHRVEGAATQLETDLQFLRSNAVARNRQLRIDFSAAGGASCYVVHTGSAGACSCNAAGAAVCTAGVEAVKTVAFGANDAVAVASNSRSLLVDPVRGTFTPTASVNVNGRNGSALRVVVNILGRVRSCTPAGPMAGHVAC